MNDFRRISKRIISPNPETGDNDVLGEQVEFHKLQDECLESTDIHKKFTNDCGCFGEPGGRCAESDCGKVSCTNCHRHCGGSAEQRPEGCGKPICRSHSVSFDLPDGRTIVLCKRCHSTLVRKLRWRTVGRLFSRPFISLEDQSDE